VTAFGNEEPPGQASTESPQGPRPTREPFWDFKASHWVEVFLTLALIAVGYLQYTVYNQQAALMNTQAQISKRQVVDTEKQLRAYLGPVQGTYKSMPGGIKAISVKIHNYGVTVAKSYDGCGNFFTVPISITPEESRSAVEARTKKEVGTAFEGCGGDDFRQTKQTVWPSEDRTPVINSNADVDFDGYLAGKSTGIFFAKMVYSDVFDVLHHTYICRWLLPIRPDRPQSVTECYGSTIPEDD
jgi:hypothetical protein